MIEPRLVARAQLTTCPKQQLARVITWPSSFSQTPHISRSSSSSCRIAYSAAHEQTKWNSSWLFVERAPRRAPCWTTLQTLFRHGAGTKEASSRTSSALLPCIFLRHAPERVLTEEPHVSSNSEKPARSNTLQVLGKILLRARALHNSINIKAQGK